METMEEKTKPIALEITFLKKEDILELANNKKYTKFILEEAYKVIKDNISDKPEKIQLFDIINFGLTISIDSKDFPKCLHSILKYYESIEDYETCSELEELIKHL